MAISNIKTRRKSTNSAAGFGVPSKSSELTNGMAPHTVQKNDALKFRDSLDIHTGEGGALGGAAIPILLPSGEINETVLTALQDAIHIAGDKLLAKQGYDTVIAYKNSVQTLLKSVIPFLHEKEDIIAPKKINGEIRQRKFTLINTVNEKLDTVLKLVLTSQSDQMRIMNTLDEIKGLIINILY